MDLFDPGFFHVKIPPADLGKAFVSGQHDRTPVRIGSIAVQHTILQLKQHGVRSLILEIYRPQRHLILILTVIKDTERVIRRIHDLFFHFRKLRSLRIPCPEADSADGVGVILIAAFFRGIGFQGESRLIKTGDVQPLQVLGCPGDIGVNRLPRSQRPAGNTPLVRGAHPAVESRVGKRHGHI